MGTLIELIRTEQRKFFCLSILCLNFAEKFLERYGMIYYSVGSILNRLLSSRQNVWVPDTLPIIFNLN